MNADFIPDITCDKLHRLKVQRKTFRTTASLQFILKLTVRNANTRVQLRLGGCTEWTHYNCYFTVIPVI